MGNVVKTFNESGDFNAMRAAENALSAAGFSVGSNERGSPRGIMHGDFVIAKWRNLRQFERDGLHGRMTCDMRNGPVTVTIFERAPETAKAAFNQAATVSA